MVPLDFVLVGNESLLIECARIVKGRGHRIVTIASRNAAVLDWARDAGIPVTQPGAGIETRITARFDWLLSIANLSVLPRGLIARARCGAVNFHDGPLPRHAGLNAPVWALLEGETRHGITWHRIEDGIDEGAILEQVHFEIAPDETAFSLNARCYGAAIDSFPALIARLESGDVAGRPQDLTLRSLHRRDDRPADNGRLDPRKPMDEIIRTVRALDHGGYWNPLAVPKIETTRGVFAVGHAERASGSAVPGTVLRTDDGAITLACADGAVRLSGLTCLGGLPVRRVADPGDMLPVPQPLPAEALSRAAQGDATWRKGLAGFAPADMPVIKGGTGQAERVIAGLDLGQAAAILSAYVPGGWALASAATRDLAAAAPAYLSPWLPLSPNGETLAERAEAIRDRLRVARDKPVHARDLVARDPALTPVTTPALGIGEAAIAGVALMLLPAPDGVRLVADLTRTDESTLELMAARLAHLATADPESPIDMLDLLSAADRALMGRLNDTAVPFDDRPIAEHVEAQVLRTPNATALVFENETLTYRALNARANRVAHVLRAMGVGPDIPVALCLHRSPDLLIGALGILKSGGGYVPMDPSYPADRLRHFLADSRAPVIVTQASLVDSLPPHHAQVLVIDRDPRLAQAPEANPGPTARPDTLAYLIYTSGSTGLPKGVMVEHRNVANFFAGMDARIDHEAGGVWLAVTSLSFDISVLELFWTLARGFKLVLTSDEDRMMVSGGSLHGGDGGMDFSLFYWGNDDGQGPRKYELLLEGAKFADTHGFKAVWTPERHFHAFGGPFPNPSVTGAAVAAVTRNIEVRAGSCVAPLHHPLRIAEEWAVIDNLTNGRVGLGMASGWHPVDFVLRPENAPPDNKAAMFRTIETVRRLWRGETVEFDRGGDGQMVPVQSLPRPVSRELPIWLTIAGNPDTWREAGEIGAHVLTHLLGQSIDEVAGKIRIYHEALRKAGHDPARFTVTLMLHTYVAATREAARETARGPMKSYLLAAAGLVKQYAWAFPAFKKPEGARNPMDIDLSTLSQDEVDGILDYAFNRYFEDSGLFGTVEDCVARVEQLKAIGVTEVGCLIDYGIPTQQVLEGLRPLAEVLKRSNARVELDPEDFSLATQMRRHGVTHLQCTPSLARMLVENEDSRLALRSVRHLMIGGEALPGALASDLSAIIAGPVQNMYGPTETTIWSTTEYSRGGEGVIGIGSPIANTTLHVLDEARHPVPVGAEGQLWIGGAGVTRGYWQRPELDAEKFIPNPFGAGRLYATGDLVRLRADGGIDFLGRTDHQVKIRGHRIELGEIESVIDRLPGVQQSVVIAREDTPGDLRLVAYVTGQADPVGLRDTLRNLLPAHMVPGHVVQLDAFPLTPNKKIDRKALPRPSMSRTTQARATASLVPAASARARSTGSAEEASEILEKVARVWRDVLGVAEVKPSDHFFHLGGHSLLAVQAHREIKAALNRPALSITDVFRFPVLSDFVSHLGGAPERPVDKVAERKPMTPKPASAVPATDPVVHDRVDAMARRRAMRAERLGRLG